MFECTGTYINIQLPSKGSAMLLKYIFAKDAPLAVYKTGNLVLSSYFSPCLQSPFYQTHDLYTFLYKKAFFYLQFPHKVESNCLKWTEEELTDVHLPQNLKIFFYPTSSGMYCSI